MKILSIIGARPQFIKAATVSRIILQQNDMEEVLIHTGQHFDNNMSDVFFEELDIQKPNYNLGIGGGGHGEQTGKMIQEIEKVLIKEKPNYVLLYGDTNSTLAGALASVKLHIPIAHVEAGLRSFNRKMPEEMNRILTDHSSDLLFVPNNTAITNLKAEGIYGDKVVNVGDVMLDAAIYYAKKAELKSFIMNDQKLKNKDFILVTIHRAENTDDLLKLKYIFKALDKLADSNTLIFPLHPRTKKALSQINYSVRQSSIRFIDPIGYLDMVNLEKNSKLIITDSGGVQKEAYFHNVPCVTLRDETEWVELVEHGWNILANSSNLELKLKLVSNIKIDTNNNIYGDGNASLKIVDKLKHV